MSETRLQNTDESDQQACTSQIYRRETVLLASNIYVLLLLHFENIQKAISKQHGNVLGPSIKR